MNEITSMITANACVAIACVAIERIGHTCEFAEPEYVVEFSSEAKLYSGIMEEDWVLVVDDAMAK